MSFSRAKIVLPLSVLGVSLLFGALLLITAPKVESVPPDRQAAIVRVVEARPETVRLRVRSQGTVAPRTESALVPEVSGRVIETSPSLSLIHI